MIARVYEHRQLLFQGQRPRLRKVWSLSEATAQANGAAVTDAMFHEACDFIGPSLCAVQLTTGDVIGGFTRHSWYSRANYVQDNAAFVYRLPPAQFDPANHIWRAIPAAGAVHQYTNSDRSLVFGNAHTFMLSFNNRTNGGWNYVNNGGGYANAAGVAVTVAAFAPGCQPHPTLLPYTDVVVFAVDLATPDPLPSPVPALADAVRALTLLEIGSTAAARALTLPTVNVGIVGEPGTGKSSLVNCILSGLAGVERNLAEVRPSGGSVTRRVWPYELAVTQQGKVVSLWDLWGRVGNYVDDAKFFVAGRLLPGAGFEDQLNEQHRLVRRNPKFADEMHCVLVAISYATHDAAVYPAVTQQAKQLINDVLRPRNVPFLVLITQCDECKTGGPSADLVDLQSCDKLNAARRRVMQALGVEERQVLLVSTESGRTSPPTAALIANARALCLDVLTKALRAAGDLVDNVAAQRVARSNVTRVVTADDLEIATSANGRLAHATVSFDIHRRRGAPTRVTAVLVHEGWQYRLAFDESKPNELQEAPEVLFNAEPSGDAAVAPRMTVFSFSVRALAGGPQVMEAQRAN